MMMFFSIIVPIYNAVDTLRDCVESILKQSFIDFELILVNDGSKDDSGRIADSYAEDDRVKVVHKENGGVSSTRNRGIKEARGQYLLFIDSDDRVGENLLWEYHRILSSYQDALVYQGFVSEYMDDNVKEALPQGSFTGEAMADALAILEEKRCLGGACNKVFRRDVVEKYGVFFNEVFSYGEDKIFTLQYLQYIEQIVFSDQCEYFYNRKTENSLSKKHHKASELQKFIKEEYYYFNKFLEKYPSDYFQKIVDSRYSSFSKYVLLSMYRKGEKISKEEIARWRDEIIHFDTQHERLRQFEMEVPSVVNKVYKSDVSMRLLMFFRENFRLLYRLIKK